MRTAVYNSGIPDRIRPADGGSALLVRTLRFGMHISVLSACVLSLLLPAWAADWSAPEQQLARKIGAITGPGTVALTIENRSSLGRRDNDIVQNGLRVALDQVGIRLVKAEQAASSVSITLSENLASYVWVAQIQQSAGESAVVMVSIPRVGRLSVVHDSTPITLHSTLLWRQNDRILDVAILEENGNPTRIAVLSPENVSFYRWGGGKWQNEQVLAISHSKPLPLDIRGRLVINKDHLIDAYLPGVICRSSGSGGSLAMNCREGEDPWPLIVAGLSGSSPFPNAGSSANNLSLTSVAAFFAPTRNFFTGVLTMSIGKFNVVPKFYSAAFVPRDRYTLWIFASADGKIHMVDGMSDQVSTLDWGSDVATIRTSCGAGWQVLATSTTAAGNSVRAYEFPDRDAVSVSAGIELPGEISALWTESRGDSAVGIVNDRETGSYDAFRLAVACGQ